MTHGIEKVNSKAYHQHHVKHDKRVIFNHQPKPDRKGKVGKNDCLRPSLPINFLDDVLVFTKRFVAFNDAEFRCTHETRFLSSETLYNCDAVVETKSHRHRHKNRK